MDQTLRQLEGEIDRSRQQLGSHLRELEARVDAATDWRTHVRARPYVALATAAAAGALVSAVLAPSRPRRPGQPKEPRLDASAPRQHAIDVKGQVNDLWRGIATTLMGVAAGRVASLIGDLVPGFRDEWESGTQHRQNFTTTTRRQSNG